MVPISLVIILIIIRAGIAQSVWRLDTGWTFQRSNPYGGKIFHPRPDRPWGPQILLYIGYPVFHGGKAAGAWGLTTNTI
jgi:hypothetical protein